MPPYHLLLVVLVTVTCFDCCGARRLDPHFSDVTVDCGAEGAIISINGTALAEALPGLDPDTLRVGEGPWLEQCLPDLNVGGSRGIQTFKFNYGDCHPLIEELSSTTLRLLYAITGEVSEDVTDSPEGTLVSCLVPKDGLIGVHLEDNTNVYDYVGSAEGTYELGITIFKDSFMTDAVENDEEIPLGNPLWVGIKLNSSSNSEMYVRDCWATPSPHMAPDQPEHIFIKNGIIGEDDETFAPSDDVITASTYGFSFDSFMFRGAGSDVYIKCQVHVCDPRLTDANKHVCSIPKYPEFHIAERDVGDLGSGSGSGYGINLDTRSIENDATMMEHSEDENADDTYDEDEDDEGAGGHGMGEEGEGEVQDNVLRFRGHEDELPRYYLMHSFKVKHVERKRRSAGSYRVYPRHTIFSNLRSGIYLGIIIGSTAMFSACAILLPLHLSGEKVRCLHLKATKRTI